MNTIVRLLLLLAFLFVCVGVVMMIITHNLAAGLPFLVVCGSLAGLIAVLQQRISKEEPHS